MTSLEDLNKSIIELYEDEMWHHGVFRQIYTDTTSPSDTYHIYLKWSNDNGFPDRTCVDHEDYISYLKESVGDTMYLVDEDNIPDNFDI